MPSEESCVNISAPVPFEYFNHVEFDDGLSDEDIQIFIGADTVEVTPIWTADGEWDRLENDLLGDCDEKEGRLVRQKGRLAWLGSEIQELQYIARRASERGDRPAHRRLDEAAGRAIEESTGIAASLAEANRYRDLAELCSYLPHFEMDVPPAHRALWRTRTIEMAPDDARRALARLRASATAAATVYLPSLIDRDQRLLVAFVEARYAMSQAHWAAWVSDSLTLNRSTAPARSGRQAVPLPADFTAPAGDSLAARRRHRRSFRQAIETFHLHENQYFPSRSKHLSQHGVNIHNYLTERTRTFLESHSIEPDSEASEGAILPTLAEAAERSHKSRVAAAITLTRAMIDLARRGGETILFVTLTLPPSWHPDPAVGRNSWDGALPNVAMAELNKRWSRLRAREAARRRRAGGGCFHGLRTVEPHKDQCPHLHALVITDDKTRTSEAIRDLWPGRRAAKIDDLAEMLAPDGTPLYSRTELVVGYCVKYITAALDGGEDDAESDEACEDKASPAVRGWASTWGVRRFSLFGLPGGAFGLWTLMVRHFYYQVGRLNRVAAEQGADPIDFELEPTGSEPFDAALAAYRRWDESHRRWRSRLVQGAADAPPDHGHDREYRALAAAARALGILPGMRPQLEAEKTDEDGLRYVDESGAVVHRNPSCLTYKIVRNQPVVTENKNERVTVIPSRPSGAAPRPGNLAAATIDAWPELREVLRNEPVIGAAEGDHALDQFGYGHETGRIVCQFDG